MKTKMVGLLVLAMTAWAQSSSSTYIFSDYFYSNSKKWSTKYNDEISMYVSGGHYWLERKKSPLYYTFRNVYINTSKDFQIEAKFYWDRGKNNYPFGIVFGYKDTQNHERFDITGNGYFRVSSYRYGQFKTDKKWTKSSRVKTGKRANILKIRKVGNYLYYYVNGSYMSSKKFQSLLGQKIGFSLANRQRIKIDYVTVKYINQNSNSTTTSYNSKNNSYSTKKSTSQIIFQNYFYINKGWSSSSSSGSYNIKSGKLRITSTSSNNYTVEQDIKIDTKRNFYLETEATWSSGANNTYFGIVFGRSKNGFQNSFAITSNGWVNFFQFDNFKYNSLYKKSSSYVKTGSQKNKIKVSKTGNYLYFYVNNKYITSQKMPTWFGDKIGLEVYGNQTVNFHKIYIKYTDNKTSTFANNTNTTGPTLTTANTTGPTLVNNNSTNTGGPTLADNSIDFFEEAFKNNYNDWPQFNDQQMFAKRNFGRYTIEGKSKVATDKVTVFPPPSFDFNSDYEIETNMTWKSGLENAGHGLVYEYQDKQNHKFFIVTANGYYMMGMYRNGSYSEQVKWTKTSDLYRKSTNTIKLVHQKNKYNVYINDKLQTTVDNPTSSPMGKKLGFTVFTKQTVDFRTLKFKIPKEAGPTNVIAKNDVNGGGLVGGGNVSLTTNQATDEDDDIEEWELAKNLPSPHPNMDNSRSVAVIIGINKYQKKTVPEVKYAKRDARLIRKYLIEVLKYDPSNILPQDPDELITAGVMKTIIKQKLPAFVKPDGSSNVFIYFSGHGAPSTTSQDAFFVPYDADPSFVNDFNGYKMAEFYSDIQDLNAKSKLVVIDACFSGTSGDGTMIIRNASPALLKIKKTTLVDDRTVLFQSSKNNQVSNWYPEKKHGMFTYFFLKGMRGDADKNKDGVITVEELSNYVNDTSDGLPYYSNRKFQRPQEAVIQGKPNVEIIRYQK